MVLPSVRNSPSLPLLSPHAFPLPRHGALCPRPGSPPSPPPLLPPHPPLPSGLAGLLLAFVPLTLFPQASLPGAIPPSLEPPSSEEPLARLRAGLVQPLEPGGTGRAQSPATPASPHSVADTWAPTASTATDNCGWEIVRPSYLMSHPGKGWILGEVIPPPHPPGGLLWWPVARPLPLRHGGAAVRS